MDPSILETKKNESDVFEGKKLSFYKVSGDPCKTTFFEQDFAEVWLDGEQMKVEIVCRDCLSRGNYLVN